jgi:hypothetical protein
MARLSLGALHQFRATGHLHVLQHSMIVGLAPQVLEKFSELLLQPRHTLPPGG